MKVKLVHMLISGRVQGVGYRAFSLRQAQELGLCGLVRNLSDGRVEVIVQGEPSTLDDFKNRLLRGPRLGQVLALEAKEVDGSPRFEGFSIVRDGDNPWSEF